MQRKNVQSGILLLLIAIMIVFASGSTNARVATEVTQKDINLNTSYSNKVEKNLQWSKEVSVETARALFNDFYRQKAVKKRLDATFLSLLTHIDIKHLNLSQAYKIDEATPLNLEDAYILVDYCDKMDLDLALVLSLIDVESEFDRFAVSYANARGYMQIIPSTERWLVKDYGHMLELEYNPERIFESDYQFGLGLSYIKELKESHGENIHRILSEYNRGPINLARYYRKHGTYSTSYSRKIMSKIDQYAHLK